MTEQKHRGRCRLPQHYGWGNLCIFSVDSSGNFKYGEQIDGVPRNEAENTLEDRGDEEGRCRERLHSPTWSW